MKFHLEPGVLRPLIHMVVAEMIARVQAEQAEVQGRLRFPEQQAVALIGGQSHVLGDARRRSEINGSCIGKRILHERAELVTFFARDRFP